VKGKTEEEKLWCIMSGEGERVMPRSTVQRTGILTQLSHTRSFSQSNIRPTARKIFRERQVSTLEEKESQVHKTTNLAREKTQNTV
jgi:hypothetical protein